PHGVFAALTHANGVSPTPPSRSSSPTVPLSAAHRLDRLASRREQPTGSSRSVVDRPRDPALITVQPANTDARGGCSACQRAARTWPQLSSTCCADCGIASLTG